MVPFLVLKGETNAKLLGKGTTAVESFSFSLNPESKNGVIFYSGSKTAKDFISLAMKNGKLEYR
jgi:hypothetical protein